jgi:hypothetical protein
MLPLFLQIRLEASVDELRKGVPSRQLGKGKAAFTYA